MAAADFLRHSDVDPRSCVFRPRHESGRPAGEFTRAAHTESPRCEILRAFVSPRRIHCQRRLEFRPSSLSYSLYVRDRTATHALLWIPFAAGLRRKVLDGLPA